MRDKTGQVGKSWWRRFNDWQLDRLAQSDVERADRVEWNLRLRARRHEWILVIWFVLAWSLALWLPNESSVLQKVLVLTLVSLPVLLLAISRFRVLRDLDEMMRRAELTALAAAGVFAIAVVIVQAVCEVFQLHWPVRPVHALMALALVYGVARRIARSRYR